MKTNKKSKNIQERETYYKGIAGAFRGAEYLVYKYIDDDGTEFSCIDEFSTLQQSLETCRENRDQWLNEKTTKEK